MITIPALILVCAVIPFAWSGLLAALRSFIPASWRSESFEKTVLFSMIIAPVLGFAALKLAPTLAMSQLPLPELAYYFGGNQEVLPSAPVRESVHPNFGPFIAPALGLLYLGGLLWNASKLGQRIAQMRTVERRSVPHESVFLTDAPISAITTLSGKIIISKALFCGLSKPQVDMIIAHEAAHRSRQDAVWFLCLSVIDCLFWFNPFARHQTERCRHAAELACDADVTRTSMPSAYAETLLIALKHSAGNALPCAPAVFSQGPKGDYRMRITRIMQPGPSTGKTLPRVAALASALMLLPLAGVQLALADETSSAHFELAFLPTEGRLTSSFGPRVHPITREAAFHRGMDIGAATGTPVRAPAAGTVVSAETQGAYGLMVTIDHGNGIRTRYAQLDTANVSAGDRVSVGASIGTVGASGQATGPHLHFEVWNGNEALNPSDYLAR